MKNSSALKFVGSILLGMAVSESHAWTPAANVPASISGTGRVHILARKLTGTTLYPTVVLAGTGHPTSAPVLSARPGHWTCASGTNSWTCQRDLPVGTVPDDTLDLTWSLTGGAIASLDSLRSNSATWTLTMSAQVPTTGTQRGYAILGLASARISDQVHVAGAIGSSAAVEIGISDTTGDIESGNSVLLHDRSVVQGSVVYAGAITLGSGVVITGTSTRGSVVLPTIDQPPCTPGTVDQYINSGKVALAPGAWNNVMVSAGAELDLSPGTYQLRSLVLQAGAKMVVTATGAGTDILATDQMSIGDRSTVTAATGSLPANIRWTYTGTSTFQVGTDIVMDGWLRAPKGTIDISSRTHINGAVHAQSVILEPQAYGIFGGIVNLPPVLTGIPVDSVAISTAWTFHPQASDPEGQSLTWTLVHGPTGATISGSGLVSWTPTAVQTGDFDVRVCDPLGACSEMGWTVHVISTNHSPVITSTAPTTGKEGLAYAYTVTATDVDGDVLHYAGGALQAGMIFDTTAHQFLWTPSFTQAGTYPVSVTVTDGKGGSVTQSWNLVIADSNRAPVITSTPPTTGKKLTPYAYTVTATDADGDALHYAVGALQTGMTFDTTAHRFAWTPSVSQLGTFPLSVTVTDGKGGSITQSWSLVISDTNHAPVITSTAPTTGKEAITYAYTVTATDVDGDALHYAAGTLQAGMTFDTTAHKFSWTPSFTQAGTYPVSVTVTDGKGGSVTQAWNLVIADSNRAPVITSTPSTTGKKLAAYAYTVTATDADGDALHYAAGTLQAGMAFDTTAHKFAWTPSILQLGTFPLSVTVTDGKGGSVTQSWSLVISDTNHAPVITSAAPTTGKEAVAYAYTVTATDVDGDALHYAAGTLQAGMTFDTTVHKFAWTPTFTQAGTYPLSVTVTDGKGGSVTQSWNLVIADSNRAPVITSTPSTTGKKLAAYAYTVTATDADGDALHFKAGTVPAGMTFDTTAHKFAWTPSVSQLGTFPLSVTVTDGKGGSVTQSWSLVISDTNHAPVITSTAPTTGKEAVAYIYTVTATDADGDALHFVAGTLQSGMTFDTTAHKFAWTPTFTQAGTYPVSVTVTDGKGGSVTQSWNLVIADSNRAPVVTSTAPTTGKEAVAYVYTVTATDADGDVLHFKAGTLQTGMTFDTTAHKFAWNPTFTQAGTYPVSVTVTDGKGGNVTQSWNLVIADSNRAPVVTSTATTSGIANVGYSYQAAATDADGDPTVWSLVSGPTGLSITSSGLVTWNPTASGSYSAQIQVSDGRGGSGMQTWSIQVAVPPPPVDTIPAAPVAPPLPAGGVPPFVSQVSFLWSGSQPTIFGVIKDSLDTARLAVLRGRVIGVDNAPIPGVRVQVIGHPEFGHTFTRADGRYELVANGGVSVWADFGKSGYLPLQRLSKPFWKQYSGVLDVVLTKLDLISTVVTSGSPQTQVAVSTPRTDAVGTRMLSVDIPAGTHARFQMPDGSTQPATQLTLRTTEYTVGPTGPLAMPSDLPTTSIYTYAFEVTADEELAAGAVHILFDHPVVTHLENFRHFPVGDIVPYGVLNRTTHRWETFPSGRVVAVLSIANGHAVLDVNGNGLPASPDTLAALGIDTAELRVIANRFTIGKTLWRVQSTRFSAGDFNWSAPPGAAAPNVDTSNGPLHKPSPCDPSRNGCVLDLEQQRLGEDFPVPGTGLSLHYRSDRSPNHIQDYRVRFRLTVPVRNQAFRGGKARLWVAGQEIDDTINGSDSIQVITLQWNGLDAWGRQLNGSVQGQLDVSYNWAEIPRPTAGFGGPCSGGCVETSSEIPEIIHPLSTVMTVPLGRLHTPGLGVQGWSIDGVQSLDRAAGYLVGGDGTDRDVLAMGTGVGNLGIDTVTYFTEARTGRQLFVHAYNIVPTFQADGAGNLYFSANTVNWMDVRGNTFGTSMLLRRRLSGVIDVLIGSTNGVAIAENAPADSIALTLPPRIFHVSRDGVIYFLDYSGDGVNRIWRRDLDGHLHRVFGGGDTLASSRSALGMKGTDLSLSDNGMINQWNVSSLAEDGDGSLHVIANQTFYNNWRFILSPAGTLESSHESSVGWLGYQNLVGHNAKDQALYIGVNGCTDVIAVYNGGGCNTLGTYDGDTANFTWEAGSLQGVQGYGGVNPSPPSFADGAPSSSGYFGPVGSIRALAAAPDGTTYILAPQSLVSAGPDSAIHQIAGVFMTNGGMSTNPRLLDLRNVFSMTVLPNGRIVLADHDPYLGTIFRTIDPTAALMSQVPSGDGKLLYVFDNWARHTFTLDALTGDTIRRMTYDSSGRVTQIMDAYGNQTTLSYSASTIDIQAPGGQHTVLNLSGGQVVSVTGPDTHSDLLSWQSGFLASHTDPMGRTSRYGFDTLGNLSYDQRPDGKRVTLSSTFDLAAQKRVAKMTQPSGRTLQATTTFLPDKGSRTVIVGEEGDTSVIRRWATGDMETTSPDHTVTHVTALEHPQFTSLVPLPGLTTVTTPNGIVSQTTMTVGVTQGSVPAYGPVRTWNDTTVTPSGTWLRAWDSLSRTWTLTDPQGRVSKIFVGRFGAVDSQRVPGLPTVSYTRDSRGRTTTVRQGGRVWRTVWGAANTVDSMVDPLGRAISLRWDASMRSLGGTTPDGRTLSLTRWADGSLASLTPSGRKAHQFFTNSLGDDSLYLPPVVDSTGGGSLLWNWTQDRTLSGMGTPVGSFSVGRDSLGRVVTVIQPSDTVRIAYDLQGRVDSLRRAGQKLAWTWDGTLPLSETWTGAVTGAVSTTWDANFRPTSQTAAGNTIAYSYDPDGTLTHAGQLLLARDPVSGFASGDTVGSIVHRLGHNGRGEILADTVRNGSVILSLATFTRDSLGRILTKADSLNGSRTNWRYHYDLAGQLDSVWANGSLNAWYGYDSNGVRLRGTGISGVTVDAQDREIAANGVAFGYDENGQMVSRSNLSGTTRYHYTLQGELLSVKLATGDSISYTLDPAGRRIARSLNGVVTNRWLWDGQLRLVAEIDLTGNLTTRYVYGTQINVPDYMIRNGTTYRLVADQLGSVRLVLNVTTGAVVSSFNYDVWGNITSTINPSFQPFGFAGGLRDDATGLTHFSARDYDPTIRRWTGKDQIGFNGGLSNIYGYVGNDPVNLRDPNGNQVAECAILVGTALTVISVSNMYHFGKSRGLGPNFHGTEISSTTSADSALKHLMLDATKQAGASVTAQEATNLLEPNPKANLLNILNTLLSHLNPEQEKGKKK